MEFVFVLIGSLFLSQTSFALGTKGCDVHAFLIERPNFNHLFPSSTQRQLIPVVGYREGDHVSIKDLIWDRWLDTAANFEIPPVDESGTRYFHVTLVDRGNGEYSLAAWPANLTRIHSDLLLSRNGGHWQLAVLMAIQHGSFDGLWAGAGVVVDRNGDLVRLTYRSGINMLIGDRDLDLVSGQRFYTLIKSIWNR